MNTHDLSIVILTKDAGELFEDVLAGLFACDSISEADVLMIDSGSSDLTLDYAKQYPQMRMHSIPSSEFATGNAQPGGANDYSASHRLPGAGRDSGVAGFSGATGHSHFRGGFAGVFGRQLPRPGPTGSNACSCDAPIPISVKCAFVPPIGN